MLGTEAPTITFHPRKEKSINQKPIIGRHPAYKWLKDLISKDCLGKDAPRHSNTKERVLLAYNNKRFRRNLAYFSNGDIHNHLTRKTKHYFTGNGHYKAKYSIHMIDIDAHKSGSLEGCKQFIEWIKNNIFPNLYWEISTGGNGVHGYFLYDHGNESVSEINKNLTILDAKMKSWHHKHGFDVQVIEIKGKCPVITWKNKEAVEINCGTLAKIPWGLIDRFEELKITTVLDGQKIDQLPEYEIKKIEKRQFRGSAAILLNEAERLPELQKFAAKLLGGEVLMTSGRTVATEQDLAIYMLILWFCSKNMNEDGTLPSARVKAIWEGLFNNGMVERAFDPKRIARMRKFLSSKGWLECVDENYYYVPVKLGQKKENGLAAKWKLNEELIGIIDNYIIPALNPSLEEQDSLTPEAIKERLEIYPYFDLMKNYRLPVRRELHVLEQELDFLMTRAG